MIVELYSRPGCHLCSEAKSVLVRASLRFSFHLVERNVEENPQWERDFGHEIPVVIIDGRKAFKHRIPETKLERILSRMNAASRNHVAPASANRDEKRQGAESQPRRRDQHRMP